MLRRMQRSSATNHPNALKINMISGVRRAFHGGYRTVGANFSKYLSATVASPRSASRRRRLCESIGEALEPPAEVVLLDLRHEVLPAMNALVEPHGKGPPQRVG